MKAIKKLIIITGIMALILFSGCNSSFMDYKRDCIDNSEVQKRVLGKELPGLTHYNDEYFDKLEAYCIEQYNNGGSNK